MLLQLPFFFKVKSLSGETGEIFAESTSSNGSMMDAGLSASMGTLIAAIVSGAVVLIVLLSIVALFLKRRICQIDGKPQPVSIPFSIYKLSN